MNFTNRRQFVLLIFLFILLPTYSFAAVPSWKIIPAESTLTFTATQNDAPVTGEFKKFSAEINFDPAQLNGNNIKVIVDLNFISDPYNQLADTLKGADWFDAHKYPQAIYTASNFIKTGDKTYQAHGMLTIRGKTLPATLTFTQLEYSQNKAKVQGSTTIKRTAFGVGRGDWMDTNTVKDEVRIDFTVAAEKK